MAAGSLLTDSSKAFRPSFLLRLLTCLITEVTLTEIESHGTALLITCTEPEIADHHWLQRRRLLQLTGHQSLQLLIALPGHPLITLNWTPAPL